MTAAREPWWVCYRCGCHQAAELRSELAACCPGHNRERIDPPEVLWATDRDMALIEVGHVCGDQPCEGPE